MKNIFVLPSDKPSRIGYIGELESYHFFNDKENNNELFDNLVVNRNIYITNSEEIKEGHYGIGHATGLFGVGEKDYLFKHDGSEKGRLNSICVGAKKIILTTDPELIKNGVQAIKDDFLEWFVKNSSCEFVEVEKMINVLQLTDREYCYKPIIPQPKQETIEEVAEREISEITDSSLFLKELKLEWCRTSEQYKSFERDLLKFAKMINDEQFKKDNFYCSDYTRCENQCEFCKESQHKKH